MLSVLTSLIAEKRRVSPGIKNWVRSCLARRLLRFRNSVNHFCPQPNSARQSKAMPMEAARFFLLRSSLLGVRASRSLRREKNIHAGNIEAAPG